MSESAVHFRSRIVISDSSYFKIALSEDTEFFHRKSRGPCSFLEGKPLVDPDTGEPTDVEVSTALERHLGLIVAHMPEHPAESPTNQP